METIRTKGWLADAPEAFRDAVIGRSDLIAVSAGEAIFRVGDEAGGIIGLREGLVELHLPRTESSMSLAHIAGPGSWFGDLAAIQGHPRRFSLVARTPCSVLRLSRVELERLCKQEPASWREVTRLMASNLTLAVNALEMMREPNITRRLARSLLILANQPGGLESTIHASQSDLSCICQTARSTTATKLSEFESQGLIRRGYRTITLGNLAALKSAAGFE